MDDENKDDIFGFPNVATDKEIENLNMGGIHNELQLGFDELSVEQIKDKYFITVPHKMEREEIEKQIIDGEVLIEGKQPLSKLPLIIQNSYKAKINELLSKKYIIADKEIEVTDDIIEKFIANPRNIYFDTKLIEKQLKRYIKDHELAGTNEKKMNEEDKPMDESKNILTKDEIREKYGIRVNKDMTMEELTQEAKKGVELSHLIRREDLPKELEKVYEEKLKSLLGKKIKVADKEVEVTEEMIKEYDKKSISIYFKEVQLLNQMSKVMSRIDVRVEHDSEKIPPEAPKPEEKPAEEPTRAEGTPTEEAPAAEVPPRDSERKDDKEKEFTQRADEEPNLFYIRVLNELKINPEDLITASVDHDYKVPEGTALKNIKLIKDEENNNTEVKCSDVECAAGLFSKMFEDVKVLGDESEFAKKAVYFNGHRIKIKDFIEMENGQKELTKMLNYIEEHGEKPPVAPERKPARESRESRGERSEERSEEDTRTFKERTIEFLKNIASGIRMDDVVDNPTLDETETPTEDEPPVEEPPRTEEAPVSEEVHEEETPRTDGTPAEETPVTEEVPEDRKDVYDKISTNIEKGIEIIDLQLAKTQEFDEKVSSVRPPEEMLKTVSMEGFAEKAKELLDYKRSVKQFEEQKKEYDATSKEIEKLRDKAKEKPLTRLERKRLDILWTSLTGLLSYTDKVTSEFVEKYGADEKIEERLGEMSKLESSIKMINGLDKELFDKPIEGLSSEDLEELKSLGTLEVKGHRREDKEESR